MSRSARFADFLHASDRGTRGLSALLGVSIIVNLVSGVMQIVTNNNAIVLGLTILALLIGLVLIYRLPRRAPIDYVAENQKPPPQPGLIVLVSKGRSDRAPLEQSAGEAIAYHAGLSGAGSSQSGAAPMLRHCWLIATAGTDGSLFYAQQIKTECERVGIRAYIETVADGFSIQKTYDLVRRIYAGAPAQTGLPPERIIADFTGGVKPMSVGMVLACAGKYPMQYMYGGQPNIATTPRELTFTPS